MTQVYLVLCVFMGLNLCTFTAAFSSCDLTLSCIVPPSGMDPFDAGDFFMDIFVDDNFYRTTNEISSDGALVFQPLSICSWTNYASYSKVKIVMWDADSGLYGDNDYVDEWEILVADLLETTMISLPILYNGKAAGNANTLYITTKWQ